MMRASTFKTDVLVIGAGVVGIAIARKFALSGLEVILIDMASTFGTKTSARNSEVIHAGIYYPLQSLKAKLCIQGRDKLYEYCRRNGVPHAKLGKLIVAATEDESEQLLEIHSQARENGCNEVRMLGRRETLEHRNHMNAHSILFSPYSGVVDSQQLMLSLLCDFENAHGTTAWNTRVTKLEVGSNGGAALLEDGTQLECSCIINSAGLNATKLLSSRLSSDYEVKFAKGDYFSYSGSTPFTTLVYPLPTAHGLGVHLTIDLNGNCKFGPDLYWVDDENYDVETEKLDCFFNAISRYWPGCQRDKLNPAYAGIRPKIVKRGELARDFIILSEKPSTTASVIHLLGIESPGLTSSLALADHIFASATGQSVVA